MRLVPSELRPYVELHKLLRWVCGRAVLLAGLYTSQLQQQCGEREWQLGIRMCMWLQKQLACAELQCLPTKLRRCERLWAVRCRLRRVWLLPAVHISNRLQRPRHRLWNCRYWMLMCLQRAVARRLVQRVPASIRCEPELHGLCGRVRELSRLLSRMRGHNLQWPRGRQWKCRDWLLVQMSQQVDWRCLRGMPTLI